jgi:peroxiredoxin
MDSEFYTPTFCPFCGEEITDIEYNMDEDEDD